MLRYTGTLPTLLVMLLPLTARSADEGVPLEVGPGMMELRRTAIAADWPAAQRAMEQLAVQGERGQRVLADVVSARLRQERVQVRQQVTLAGERAELEALEQRLIDLRAETQRMLDRLETGSPTRELRQRYAELEQAYSALRPAYQARLALFELMNRRAWMLSRVQQTGGELTGTSFDAEAELFRQVRQALGMAAAQPFTLASLGDDRAPAGERARLFWLYSVSRQIEQFNQPLEMWVDALELANARMVNNYREVLGLLPLEYDPRLVQSARRHSREMVELRYNAHVSPTPRNRTLTQRLSNAGYNGGGGENIAWGQRSAEQVFWEWFESPDHHLNMLDTQYTSIGVGRWNAVWTQNFGMGQRWMLEGDGTLHAQVRGDLVEPQDPSTAQRTVPQFRRGRRIRN